MKIDILTFSNVSNFGAVLQAFALQHYLNSLGHEVKHIDFTYKAKQKNIHNVEIKAKENQIKIIYTRLNDKIRRNRFATFCNRYLSYSSTHCKECIPANIDNCDMYIVGSDQVWNTDLNGGNSGFYLDFVTKGKKVAYAASVGRNITDEDKSMLMKYCSAFDTISVRENSLKEYLMHELQIASSVVIDPVFLIDRKEWRIIEKKVITPTKYILCYLMEDTLGIREASVCLAEELGAKILWINGGSVKINDKTPFPGKEIKRMGPQQFMYLIDHSVAVVTNSFHGAAFSLIFGKKLCLIEHSKRNERLIQLLDYIKAKEKMVSCDQHIRDINFAVIEESNEKFENIIQSSKEFLQKSLSI